MIQCTLALQLLLRIVHITLIGMSRTRAIIQYNSMRISFRLGSPEHTLDEYLYVSGLLRMNFQQAHDRWREDKFRNKTGEVWGLQKCREVLFQTTPIGDLWWADDSSHQRWGSKGFTFSTTKSLVNTIDRYSLSRWNQYFQELWAAHPNTASGDGFWKYFKTMREPIGFLCMSKLNLFPKIMTMAYLVNIHISLAHLTVWSALISIE